jgi:hypothetical protein
VSIAPAQPRRAQHRRRIVRPPTRAVPAARPTQGTPDALPRGDTISSVGTIATTTAISTTEQRAYLQALVQVREDGEARPQRLRDAVVRGAGAAAGGCARVRRRDYHTARGEVNARPWSITVAQ